MICKNCERENFTLENEQKLVEEQLSLELLENLVCKEEKEIRLQVCAHCPFNLKGQCVKCGCFINFRTSLKIKHCPVDYW